MTLRRTIYSTLGTDVQSAAIDAGQIAGIRIDNPSGSWLFVTSIDQFVPPYVNGWQYPVVPNASSISVRFVDSPSGSLSNLIGDPPVIYLYDQPIAQQAGMPSGAGARVTIVPPFLTVFDTPTADEPKNAPVATMLLIPTRPVILREISGTHYFVNGNFALGYFAPHASVQLFWRVAADSSNPPIPPFTFQWTQTISLETPYVSTQIPDGAVRIEVGQALFVDTWTEPGGGMLDVVVQAAYYEEAS